VKFKVQVRTHIHGQGDFGNEVIHGLTFHEEVVCDSIDEVEEIIYKRHGKDHVTISSIKEDPIQNDYHIGKTGHEL
tara:strand:+ start:347 stop:574 length:228 start_codon:yes stop_codon:yes gene_type:complete